MNDINLLDDIDEMYTCECGSIFFDEFQARTYLDSNFISYGPNNGLNFNDKSITIAKCILCNKIHIPRTSFAGRSILDRQVQLYATLYKQVSSYTESLSTVSPEVVIPEIVIKEVDKNVEAESNSATDNKDAISSASKGSSTRKNNKK